jgi:hypothetical protein
LKGLDFQGRRGAASTFFPRLFSLPRHT